MSLANQKYVCILKEIINAGDLVTTRNHEVYSSFNLPNVTFTTTPLVTLRKTAWKKALREMEWFLTIPIRQRVAIALWCSSSCVTDV